MSSVSPEEANSPAIEDRCPICLNQVTEPSHVKGCNHTFCLNCLRQWSSTRHSPRCPLCQAEITVLCHADGQEPVVPPPPLPDSSPPDLDCLDHSYFAAEASRLLRRARSMQHGLSAASWRRSTQSETAVAALDDIIASLADMKYVMDREETQFDPEHVLSSLYGLESMVSAIQEGSWEADGGAEVSSAFLNLSGSGGGEAMPRRLSAADAEALHGAYAWSDEDDEEEDFVGDDYVAFQGERLGRMSLGAGQKRRGRGGGGHGRRGSKGGGGSLGRAASNGSLDCAAAAKR